MINRNLFVQYLALSSGAPVAIVMSIDAIEYSQRTNSKKAGADCSRKLEGLGSHFMTKNVRSKMMMRKPALAPTATPMIRSVVHHPGAGVVFATTVHELAADCTSKSARKPPVPSHEEQPIFGSNEASFNTWDSKPGSAT